MVFAVFPTPKPGVRYRVNTNQQRPSYHLWRRGVNVLDVTSRHLLHADLPTCRIDCTQRTTTNREVLELYETSVTVSNLFISTGTKGPEFTYFYVLRQWLEHYMGIDRTPKAVNAKVKDLNKRFLKVRDAYNVRLNEGPFKKLCEFLDAKFSWACSSSYISPPNDIVQYVEGTATRPMVATDLGTAGTGDDVNSGVSYADSGSRPTDNDMAGDTSGYIMVMNRVVTEEVRSNGLDLGEGINLVSAGDGLGSIPPADEAEKIAEEHSNGLDPRVGTEVVGTNLISVASVGDGIGTGSLTPAGGRPTEKEEQVITFSEANRKNDTTTSTTTKVGLFSDSKCRSGKIYGGDQVYLTLKEENEKLERQLRRQYGKEKRVLETLDNLKKVVNVRNKDLLNDFQKANEENAALKDKLKQVQRVKRSMIERQYHENKVDKLHERNQYLSASLQQAKLQLEAKEEENGLLQDKLEENRKKKNALRKTVGRREVKLAKVSEQANHALRQFRTDEEARRLYQEAIIEDMQKQVDMGKKTKTELENQIAELHNIETKFGGAYCSNVRLAYYDLLTKGVSANIIQGVIKSVLTNMTEANVANLKLPSRSSAQRFVTEAGELAKVRTAFELAKKTGSIGHHSDGTTKSLVHWGTHILKLDSDDGSDGNSLQERTFTLCVSPVPSGKASDTVEQLQAVLSETQEVADMMGLEYKDDSFSVSRIVARMSDRAANERAVTTILEKEKENIFQDLAEEERAEKVKIRHWTCASHKVDNMVNSMTEAAGRHLYGATGTDQRKMSGAKKQIYEVNKLICEHSKKEYSRGADFKMFALDQDMLEESGAQKLQPIVGNRYNIFLLNSVPTLTAKDLILVYLETLRETKDKAGLNLLELSVYKGYLDEKINLELYAYVICFFYISQPLLQQGKSSSTPIAMNWFYRTAVQRLAEFADDPTDLMRGTVSLWPGAVKEDDPFYRDVQSIHRLIQHFSGGKFDELSALLKVMITAGRERLALHAKEHLEMEPTEADVAASKIIGSATNDIVESCFGTLDRQVNLCPVRHPMNTSAIIIAKKDKPVEYVQAQAKDVQEMMVKAARLSASKKRKLVGTKIQQQKVLWDKSAAEKQERAAKRQCNRNKRQKTFDDRLELIKNGGLVRNVDGIQRKTGKDLDEQMRLWGVLQGVGLEIKQVELIKGISSATVAVRRNRLGQLIAANSDLDISANALLTRPNTNHVVVTPDTDNEEEEEGDTDLISSDEEDVLPANSVSVADGGVYQFKTVGEHVAVAFAGGVWYIGHVVSLESAEWAVVNYYHPASKKVPIPPGTLFRFPNKVDEIRTDSESVFLNGFTMDPASSTRLDSFHPSVDVPTISRLYNIFAVTKGIPLQ